VYKFFFGDELVYKLTHVTVSHNMHLNYSNFFKIFLYNFGFSQKRPWQAKHIHSFQLPLHPHVATCVILPPAQANRWTVVYRP